MNEWNLYNVTECCRKQKPTNFQVKFVTTIKIRDILKFMFSFY